MSKPGTKGRQSFLLSHKPWRGLLTIFPPLALLQAKANGKRVPRFKRSRKKRGKH